MSWLMELKMIVSAEELKELIRQIFGRQVINLRYNKLWDAVRFTIGGNLFGSQGSRVQVPRDILYNPLAKVREVDRFDSKYRVIPGERSLCDGVKEVLIKNSHEIGDFSSFIHDTFPEATNISWDEGFWFFKFTLNRKRYAVSPLIFFYPKEKKTLRELNNGSFRMKPTKDTETLRRRLIEHRKNEEKANRS